MAVELPTCPVTASAIEEIVMDTEDKCPGADQVRLGSEAAAPADRASSVEAQSMAANVSETARLAVETGDNLLSDPPALGNIYRRIEEPLITAQADLDVEEGVPRAG